jgi:TonB family protein
MAHRYYPQVAAQRGEQGVVTVHMHINRSGRVTAVDLVAGSGSQFIDAAALGTWRGAQLAPFPTNTPEDEADITISMMYVIAR